MHKTYDELLLLPTFEDRFAYLKMGGVVGRSTFGFDRYLNQTMYRSKEWRQVRDKIILRDMGCDLGISDRQIFDRPLVHHINPISIEDIENGSEQVFALSNLILTSHNTHNAIHYGDESLLPRIPKDRTRGDTELWTAFSHL